MKQLDIFRERMNYYRETLGSDPQYLTLNTWEFSQLKNECESFGTVAMTGDQRIKQIAEHKYDDQVGTLFGVPVRVSKVNQNNVEVVCGYSPSPPTGRVMVNSG